MVLTLGESWPVLVGKRFLSLCAADGVDDDWDVQRVAEWPWLAGTVRAVSHPDVSRKDLKVSRPRVAVGTRSPLAGRPESWRRTCGCCGGDLASLRCPVARSRRPRSAGAARCTAGVGLVGRRLLGGEEWC